MLENILHIGLCLPRSCSNDQVHDLIQKLFDSSEPEKVFETIPRVLEVKHPKFNPQFFLKKSVIALGACFIVAAFLSRRAINLEKTMKNDNNNNIALGIERETNLSLSHKIIQCFNYEQNKNTICSRELSKTAVNSISGMRYLEESQTHSKVK